MACIEATVVYMSLKLHNTQIDRDLASCGKPIDFPIRAPCGNRETWSSADWGSWDGVVPFGDDFVVHLSLLTMMMDGLACIGKAMLRSWLLAPTLSFVCICSFAFVDDGPA